MQTARQQFANVIPIKSSAKPQATRDRAAMAASVSAAHSPSSLAAILVALVESQVHNRIRPATIQYTRNKAAQVLDFFGPAKEADSFTKADIVRYVTKRRTDPLGGGITPKPIRTLADRVKKATALIAAGSSVRRAARVVALPVDRLRREIGPRSTRHPCDATIKKEVDVLIQALILASEEIRPGVRLYHGDHKVLRHRDMEGSDPKQRALTHQEFAKLELCVREDRRPWLLTMVRTGCRYGELHRITAEDIDHVNRRCQLRGFKGRKQKKERLRWVPLSNDVYELLAARAVATPNGYLFPHLGGCPLVAPAKRKPNKEVLCTCVSDFHRILRIGTRKAQIPAVTPNDLRRTYCTWMARAGCTEAQMKKFMGHSPNSALIHSVYLQLMVDEGQEAVAKLDQIRSDASEAVTVNCSSVNRKP